MDIDRDQDSGQPVSYLCQVAQELLNAPAPPRLQLRQMIRLSGETPTKAQAIEMSQKRERLMKRVERFQGHAAQWVGADAVESMLEGVAEPGDFWVPDGMDIEEDWSGPDGQFGPEQLALHLPSTLPTLDGLPPELLQLARKELEIRKGHGNDALHSLRLLLGKKSFQFRERLRPAVGKVQKTRAWAAIRAVNMEISHYARVYAVNRSAMIHLGITQAELADTYPELLPQDLVTSTAILQPNLPGQSSQRLSWIWTHHLPSTDDDTHLAECKHPAPSSR